ncbi:hypothetical protein PN286_13205 [Romboutsia sp. 1001216sp1]|uniref:hypothetical protein n=1 Tax=unclassified Romboutsia TaxID=2626894 RepID=UPI001897E3AA|nr:MULTISPECIES: hypothetical protein [unclassified Romboutsia]MDB8810775.1 hypothetical protein [Romboutsia sp. 1001216sp1]MDB8820119.1 hypothetical protein [Romboutsia sp. 1001216sp1]MDB8824949.1 hypothetical protein [Romboutsia sp. 1001216sp1]
MEKIKKIFYVLTTILEILLLVGAYMVNYFTHKKMGMLRHVVHKNYVWEDKYPIQTIQYIAIIALITLMLLVLILYMKRKVRLKKIVTTMSITMVILVLFFIGFILIYSAEEIRAFYYISVMLGLMTLIQIIKTFIGVIWYKN